MPTAHSQFRITFWFAWNFSSLLLAPITASLATAADPAPSYADLSYGPHPHQRIDVYLPPDGNGPYPVVLWFGGIWKPAKHPARLDYFGKAHCAVIAVQTRTMTDGVQDKVSAPISYVANDACRAVQFVRLNAAKWKLDPQRIAVGGGSQGRSRLCTSPASRIEPIRARATRWSVFPPR